MSQSRSADPNRLHPIAKCSLLVGLLVLGAPSTSQAVVGAWPIPQTGSDWFEEPTDWVGGVPNAPGDVAGLYGARGDSVAATLSQAVTVGELQFHGNSSVLLNGPGSMTLDNLSPAPARIEGLARASGRLFEVAAPVSVASGGELILDANSFSTVKLSGGLNLADGRIRKLGDGGAVLASEVTGLTGGVEIEAGVLRIERTQILANTEVNVAAGATLKIVSPFDTPELNSSRYAIPSLYLNGGALQVAAPQNPIGGVAANAAITLLSDSTILSAGRTDFTLFGSISGDGGLTLLHSGESRESMFSTDETAYVHFVADATYAGDTVVGPGVSLRMAQGSQLGDTVGVTRVMGGQLVLTGGGGAEQIEVDRGTLVLEEAASPYGHVIAIRSGRLSGENQSTLTTPVVLSTDVHFSEGMLLGEGSTSDGFVLQGQISGTGSIGFAGQAVVEGGLTARGNLYTYHRSDAQFTGPLEIAGEAFVERGGVRLVGEHDLSGTSFRLAPEQGVPGANLTIAGDVSIGALVLDTANIGRDDASHLTTVVVEQGATLNLAGGVQFRGGKLSGDFSGQPTLVKKGLATGYLADGAASSFQRIDVENGSLILDGDPGSTPGAIHLSPRETVRLELNNTGVYAGAVHANSTPGRRGAVVSIGTGSVFDGELDLGAGVGQVSGALGPNASIQGVDVVLGGVVQGGDHTYSGATEVAGGGITLVDAGRLGSTSGVIGQPGTRLVLDNSGAAAHPDRLPDSVPISLNGTTVSLIGRSGDAVAETLGEVTAAYGTGGLDAQAPNEAGTSAVLQIASLVRQRGAAVEFSTSPNAQIMFDNGPTLNDGLIGGWALANGELATYGPQGVVPYSEIHSYTPGLESATGSDNVRLNSGATLTGDALVNSLSADAGEIDLAGHQLTIDSGALATRTNTRILGEGELTVGGEAGGELLVSGGGRIEASVVDGAAGPVGVTAVSGDLRLYGANAYSGPTTVNNGARLFIDREAAIPNGGDVMLNGGVLILETGAESTLGLGQVALLGRGRMTSEAASRPRLEPESVLLESGTIANVDLVGEAPLTKIGSGVADFADTLRLFNGPITIEGGVLRSYYSPDPDSAATPAAIAIASGGTLRIDSNASVAARPLHFNGGALSMEDAGEVSAPILLLAGGGTIRGGEETTRISSPVSGEGDLVIEGGLGVDALIHFDSDLSGWSGDLHLAGGPIRLGEQFRYEKPLALAASRVWAPGGSPFGEAVVSVPAGSQLVVSAPFSANVELGGGVLHLAGINASLSGDLEVSGHSYLFVQGGAETPESRPTTTGSMRLDHDSQLVVTQPPSSGANPSLGLFQQRLLVESDLTVHGTATIASYDCLVELTGTLSPATVYAELRLEGNDTFEFNGSIELSAGKTLALIEDGAPAAVSLGGAASRLAGSGQFIGDAILSDGAAVSPGNSPGVLSIDGSLTLGPGAVYDWEIADAGGVAGDQQGWDLLTVSEQILFESTPEDPAIIRIAASSGGGPPGVVHNWDPSRYQSWLIATAADLEGFDPSLVVVDAAGLQSVLGLPAEPAFRVQRQGASLLLVYGVPEPAALALLCLLAGAPVRLRRQSA